MKKIVSLIVLMMAVGSAFAANGLLWKVSGNGVGKPSYILGSHHMVPAAFVDSIPGLVRVAGEVDAFYGEVTKDALTSPESQQKMMVYMMAPADSTLSKVLTPGEMGRLDSLLTVYMGMPGMTAQLEPMKPGAVSVQLAMMQMMTAFPQLQSQQPFDAVVLSMGEANGKEMGGLETVEAQLDILFGDPLSVQAADLMEGVDNNERQIQQALDLTNSYLKQDLDALTAITVDPAYGMTPEALDRMIYRRNRAWAETLSGLLPAKSMLVVVGSGHLGGDQGLINLLRGRGFTVEPVEK